MLILIFLLLTAYPAYSESEVYNHPAGLQFVYPTEWSTSDSSFADTELVPPDQSQSEQGPTEAYFLWGIGLDSERSAQSQVEFKLHELMPQIAGFLEQKDEPESFIGKKFSGLIYTWEGIRADGITVRARVFVCPVEDVAFLLVALGVREEIIKRESELTKIFGSFTYTPGTSNPELSGSWTSVVDSGQTQTAQTSPLEGSAEKEQSSLVLNSDGTFVMSSIPGSSPAEPNEILSSSEGTSQTKGSWFSSAEKIYFISPGNVALTYRYELKGDPGSRRMTLIHPSGSREDLMEVRKDSEKSEFN